MDWLARALALPDAFLSSSRGGGGGVIHGSASEAIVTCMVAARERYIREKVDKEGLGEGTLERDDRIAFLRGKLVALSSDQTHSSTQKGALVAGTRYRSIATDFEEDLALTAEKLQRALEECKRDGLEPFYLTTSLGTTATCAVDDFDGIGKVKEKWPNLWIHVDAAYAGAALICGEYQHYSKTFTMADSFNINMHKWLLVNFDASCLFVQKRNDLTSALSVAPSYLQNKHTDSGLVTDYRDWQIPLGRRFRALKIWFVMRTYGIEGMQAHIRKTIAIGKVFEDLVRARDDLFEIVAPSRFALTCFRVKPGVVIGSRPGMNGTRSSVTEVKQGGLTGDLALNADAQAELDANSTTKETADLINERGDLFLTSSTTAGKCMIRVVSANANAEEKYVRSAFEIIVKTTEKVLAQRHGLIANGHAN